MQYMRVKQLWAVNQHPSHDALSSIGKPLVMAATQQNTDGEHAPTETLMFEELPVNGMLYSQTPGHKYALLLPSSMRLSTESVPTVQQDEAVEELIVG